MWDALPSEAQQLPVSDEQSAASYWLSPALEAHSSTALFHQPLADARAGHYRDQALQSIPAEWAAHTTLKVWRAHPPLDL